MNAITWFRQIGTFEIAAIALFIGAYLIYLLKIRRIASRLKAPYGPVSLKLILRSLIFALLLLAFLGPSFGESRKEIKSIGKDIIMCIDLSASMDAFDVPPTRIEKVKFEMKRIVDAFSSDRIGVIIFSSEAFVQSPLTHDQNALNLFIETMHTGLVPPSGTDFSPPLRMALKKLTADPKTSSRQMSKIIILVSDGEDFGEDADEVAEQVRQAGVRLYTLGVGTREGSQLRDGRGLKKDRDGNTVVTKLEDSSLRRLAKETGGAYFEISDQRNEVPKLINQIGSIEGELKDIRYLDVANNQYHVFLLVAVGLLLIDATTSPRTIKL